MLAVAFFLAVHYTFILAYVLGYIKIAIDTGLFSPLRARLQRFHYHRLARRRR